MPKVVIEVSGETMQSLTQLVAKCNQAHKENSGANTHGELTVKRLLGMLAEDAAYAVTRPGSWEGSNMWQVLTSHGY